MKLATPFALFSTLSLFVGLSLAAPTLLVERDGVTVMSQTEIDSYTPYTLFASASYCAPAKTKTWDCGPACKKLPGFNTTASGGDGTFIQYWFVGYYPSMDSVVVVYQGTDPFRIFPIVTDADFFLTDLDSTLFPGLPSSIKVHSGFLEAFKRSEAAVLTAVLKTAADHGTKKVTLIGHSMGAALGKLAAASLKQRMATDFKFKIVGYGTPRMGNQQWVNWVDANIPDKTRINNKDDPVPILPGRFLGFVGDQGEIHIKDNGNWNNCPGDDNPSSGCTVKDVGNIFISNILQHLGPYNGVLMGLCGMS